MVLMLALSAALLGTQVLSLGGDALEVLREKGVEQGIRDFGNRLLHDLVENFGIGADGFTDEVDLAVLMRLIPGFVALGVFCLAWPLIWLTLAKRTFATLKIGMMSLFAEMKQSDLPLDWQDPENILLALDERKGYRRNDTEQLEYGLIGKGVQHLPPALKETVKRLFNPIKPLISNITTSLFWGALTVLVFIFLSILGTSISGFTLPSISDFVVHYISYSAKAVAPWAIALVAIAGIGLVLDYAFLRAITPKTVGEAERRLDVIDQKMKNNAKPAQILKALRRQLGQKGSSLRFIEFGSEIRNKENDNHGDFEVGLLIEDNPQELENYAKPAVKLRLFAAFAFKTLAAAVILFLPLPFGALSGYLAGDLSLQQIAVTPIWLAMVFMTYKSLNRQGERIIKDAIVVENITWYRGPLMVVQLMGSVNTQKVTLGRSEAYGFGTEGSLQQASFNVHCFSAVVTAVSEEADHPRLLWSFRQDDASDRLHDMVVEFLNETQKKSIYEDFQLEIGDTESMKISQMRATQAALQNEGRQAMVGGPNVAASGRVTVD